MKKAKIFNKIVFISILLVLSYCYSCVGVYATCKKNKYHAKSTIAGAGDGNYYSTVKIVFNLDDTLSDAEKAEYGKVSFTVGKAIDGLKNNIKDNIECSNDNSSFKKCSEVYFNTTTPIYIRLKRSTDTAKFTVDFVGSEKNAGVKASTEGYCKDDITISVIYEGFNNTPQETSISYKYTPKGEDTFGRAFKCNSSSYSDNFERDFCNAWNQAEYVSRPSVVKSLTCNYKTIYLQKSQLKGKEYYKNTTYLKHSDNIKVQDSSGNTYKKVDGKYVLGYLTYEAAGVSDKDPVTCKKTCQEVLEVKYGPPVASKAGMCFEYKVKIISRVNCYSKLEHKPIRDYKVCTPSPSCIQNGTEYNTAGPNEAFDSCVNSCDGGKYTSKCSRECYKKIYGDNKRNVSSSSSTINATKLRTDCPGKDSRLCDSSCTYCSNGPKKEKYVDNYSENYKAEEFPNRGYYFRSGNGIEWRGDANSTGGYRGVSLFKFQGYVAGRWYNNTTAWGYYSTNYGVYENDGFYRGGDSGNYCHDNCSWDGCGAETYLNEDDLFDTISRNEDVLEDAEAACKINSVCTTSTEDYVTFRIKAGSNNMPSAQDDKINFKSDGWISDTRKDGSTLMYDTFDDKGLISCYDNKNNTFFNGVADKKTNTQVSRATWHFPGTWFDLKTNGMSYTPHDNWYEVKDSYCTSTATKNVNVEWWNYYVNKIKTEDLKKSEEDRKYEQEIFGEYDKQCKNTGEGSISKPIDIISNSYKPNMNIVASTRGFGFFGWNIDVNCFYALNTCVSGYKIRSISTADTFPNKSGTIIKKEDEIGRNPGFNWSDSSVVNKNDSYVVDPPKLITEIQHYGQAGKDALYKDENLDYVFDLTSLDLKYIRNEFVSVKRENYNNYNGKVYDPKNPADYKVIYNGIPRYKSDLIDKLVNTRKAGRRPPGDGFICNNIKTLSTGECDDYKSYKEAKTIS